MNPESTGTRIDPRMVRAEKTGKKAFLIAGSIVGVICGIAYSIIFLFFILLTLINANVNGVQGLVAITIFLLLAAFGAYIFIARWMGKWAGAAIQVKQSGAVGVGILALLPSALVASVVGCFLPVFVYGIYRPSEADLGSGLLGTLYLFAGLSIVGGVAGTLAALAVKRIGIQDDERALMDAQG